MRQITKDVRKLKDKDLVNILLFGLYKLTKDPDYSAISELAYVLDKDSLFKLCATFGGATIKIPQLSEFRNITKALLLIELMANGMSFEDAYEEADVPIRDKEEVIHMYSILTEVIEEYEA